jgi:hypothetical protein
MQRALEFIRYCREELTSGLFTDAGQAPGSLEKLVQLAQSHGFDISLDQLRKAYVVDWQMRWWRHKGLASKAENQASN